MLETSCYMNLYAQLYFQLFGNATSITVSELTPDTTYSFAIEACTTGGCTQSDSTQDLVTLRAC